jgi:hypothetical protein
MSQRVTLDLPDDLVSRATILATESNRQLEDVIVEWIAQGSDSDSLGPGSTRVLQEIEELRDLEDDWDSYGGAPPTEASLSSAKQLIERVERHYRTRAGEHVCPFDVAPIPRGGVQIEWRSPDVHLEVEVGPAGDYSYLLKRIHAEGREYEEAHEVDWDQLRPQFERVLLSA